MTLRFSAVVLFCCFALHTIALPNDGSLDWKRSVASSLLSTPTSTPIDRLVVQSSQSTTSSTHSSSTKSSSHQTKPTTTAASNITHSSKSNHAFSPAHAPSRPMPSSHHTGLPPGPGHASHGGHFHHTTNVAAIFFEVLGGIAGLCTALALTRCLVNYLKTPGNRRPPTPEVAEAERTVALLRTPFHLIPDRPPPPPYLPAPDYEQVARDSPPGDTMECRSTDSTERTHA